MDRAPKQNSFGSAVEQAYQQCAVTKEHSIPALEAAHIKPYSLEGFHEVNNGLLLRADIHKLYDKGYVTITPDYYFKVSEHLKSEFHNGRIYYEMNSRKISFPDNPSDRPNRENLITAIFEAINQLLTPPPAPPHKIGFEVKENV
jgi:putative restriction endonuclease